jgi:uncharacterized RDD family membrane protein YckC
MSSDFEQEIDDLMDEFDFKPITKGLGFHHSLAETSKIKTELNAQSIELKNELDTRSKKLLSSFGDNKKTSPSIETNEVTHMGELAPFYNQKTKQEEIPKLFETEEMEEIRFHNASMSHRFFAYVVDLGIILFMFAVTFVTIFIAADLPFDFINKIMVSNEILPSFILIFALFYTFYFSITDKTAHSSFGKKLLRIKIVYDDADMSLVKSFSRTLVSIIALLSFGVLTMLSVTDAITNTRVVQK